MKASEKQAINRERWEILQQIEDWLETPKEIAALRADIQVLSRQNAQSQSPL